MKLTPEQKQIKIAKACGRCTCQTYDKTGDWETAVCYGCGKNPFFAEHNLPAYDSDLNAMHEAEKILKDRQLEWFEEYLGRIVFKSCGDEDWSEETGRKPSTKPWHATATHRFEALGQTLELWKAGE